MLNGSCLCGRVTYEISSPIDSLTYCHCSRCRKASGSAFSAVTPVNAKKFRILSGQIFLSEYLRMGVSRFFCRNCGSPIFSTREDAHEILRVRLGTLDSTVTQKVSAHIFVGSKAEWDDILDNASQHVERPEPVHA